MNKILFFIGIPVVTLIAIGVVTFATIRSQVLTTCHKAQGNFSGSCEEALLKTLNSSSSFSEKNHAIWALGQLAQPSSLPTLQSYLTGTIPSQEKLSESISQYELTKAIRWCENGNATSWMYKNL